MALTECRFTYLWQFDRLANVAEVFKVPSLLHAGTVDLTASGLSADPTPDLAAASPWGNRIFVSPRGPKPQTGAHASVGISPGLGIIELGRGGREGSLEHILPTYFANPVDGAEESDPHGICIRLK